MDNTEQTNLDLAPIVQAVKRRLLGIIFFATFFTGLVALFLLTVKPVYQASTTIQIESQQAQAVDIQQVYGVDFSRREYFETQYAIIKSDTIARDVIKKLNLGSKLEVSSVTSSSFLSDTLSGFFPTSTTQDAESPEFQEELKMQVLLKEFFSSLSVTNKMGTRLVSLSYESTDPKLAAEIANAIAEAYIQREIIQKTNMTQKASGWLTERLSTLRVQLDKSEANLQEFREAEDLIDFEGSVDLLKKELEQTSEQLVTSRNDLNKLESISRIIDEYGSDNLDQLESIPEVTSHSVVQAVQNEVRALERKVSELSEIFGPKHPKMIAANSELKTAKQNLNKQIKNLIAGVQKEVTTTRATIASLERSLKVLRGQFQNITRKETDYLKLKREVETNRKLYDAFLTRSKETEVSSDFNLEAAKVIDPAYVPTKPIKPNKKLIVAITFIGCFVFAVSMIAFLTLLNDTIKSSTDVEQKLAQRMLGLLPLQPVDKEGFIDPYLFFNKEERQFSEAVRTFRTGFVLSQMERECKVIEVTSSIPGEGKTTTSSNLAFSLAQMENVLLIDADMRKPSICKRFNIPNYHPGLANFIAGTEKFEDCIYKDERSGLTIMPCGQIPLNPLELLSSKRFEKMIQGLKAKYDRVVIDTAPTQAVSDSLVISQHADAVIYVVKCDSTRPSIVKNGLGRLLEVKANVAGVILNKVDVSKTKQQDGYYDYYGYHESEKEQ